MNRMVTLLFTAVIGLTLLTTACQPIQPIVAEAQSDAASVDDTAVGAVTDAEVAEEFRQFVLMAEEAFQSGDVAQIIDYYADDALSHPPGYPTSVGKEAIRADLEWYFDTYTLDRDFTLTDYEVVGDYGTRSAEWTQILTPKDGGDSITEIGRCTFGFKRVDGEWKIAWEIWNTYEPISP